jgi:hypothetical protein
MPKHSNKTAPKRKDILDQLSGVEAKSVLRALAQDTALAARIQQLAEAYLEGNAPHTFEDAAAIAEEVRYELEQLEVEEVWDRAGKTRHGYVETGEVADEMIARVLEPYLEGLARYQRLKMHLEATYLCLGVLQGLYTFEHQSRSAFKDWATDLPLGQAEIALEQWRKGGMTRPAIEQMRNFILEHLPHRAYAFNRTLTRDES